MLACWSLDLQLYIPVQILGQIVIFMETQELNILEFNWICFSVLLPKDMLINDIFLLADAVALRNTFSLEMKEVRDTYFLFKTNYAVTILTLLHRCAINVQMRSIDECHMKSVWPQCSLSTNNDRWFFICSFVVIIPPCWLKLCASKAHIYTIITSYSSHLACK